MFIKKVLTAEYPELISKRIGMASRRSSDDFEARDHHGSGSTRFVFVGKEMEEERAASAVDIFESFCTTDPHATLDVYGVDSSAVPKVMRERVGVRFMGWSQQIPWVQYDVLVHPADMEPFGMVIAEARAYGVAVIMSDQVGAADMAFNCARVVSIDAPVSEWVSELLLVIGLMIDREK